MITTGQRGSIISHNSSYGSPGRTQEPAGKGGYQKLGGCWGSQIPIRHHRSSPNNGYAFSSPEAFSTADIVKYIVDPKHIYYLTVYAIKLQYPFRDWCHCPLKLQTPSARLVIHDNVDSSKYSKYTLTLQLNDFISWYLKIASES